MAKQSNKKQSTSNSKTTIIRLSSDDFIQKIKDIKKSTQNDNIETLLKNINDSGVLSPVLITGDEDVRIKRLITWFRDSVFGQNSTLQCVHSSTVSNEKTLSNLLTSLANMSIFADYRAVAILDVDSLKVALLDILASYMTKHSSDVVLFLTAKPLSSKKRTASLDTVINNCRTIVNLNSLTPFALKNWVRAEFKRAGASQNINDDALDLLISLHVNKLHGNSLNALVQEVAKLSLVAPHNTNITLQMVRQTSWGSPEKTSFQLIHLIANRDLIKSLATLHDLLNQGQHPLQLSAFLSRAFRTMLAQISLVNTSNSNLHSDLNNAWFVKNLQPAIRSFTMPNIKKSLIALKRLDEELKSSNFPAEHLMENFVIKTALRL